MPVIDAAKTFVALFASILLLSMGSALQNTLLSLNLRYSGFPEYIVALTMSGYHIGMIAGFFICQQAVRQAGHIRAFTAFSAIASVAAVAHGFHSSPVLWFILRFMSGICIASLYMVVESWLNEMVAHNIRGRMLSLYMIVVYFGNGIGQVMLNMADIEGSELFMILGILFSLCIVPVALTRSIHPKPLKVVTYNFINLFRLAPFSMLGSFISGMILGAFYVMGPVYCIDRGFDLSMITLFMMVTIWSGLIFQWPMGSISDRFDRLTILAGLSVFVTIVSSLIIMTEVAGFPTLLILSIFFGLSFTIYPVSVARAQDNIDEENIVPISAALILCYSIGNALGPILSSGFMHTAGTSGLYLFCALSTGIMAILSLFFRRRRAGRTDDLTPFVPLPRTSPVISSLHPHRPEEVEMP
ncbi:MAG: MFS transporter [Desulfamplus sp.]|nr:MFS transporter [Desulfamplus sp.]